MAGRPTVYKETMPEELTSLMAQGKLDIQVCAIWDISRDTFYRWLREKEDLKEAYDRGMVKCEAYYIDLAQRGMIKENDKGFKYFISIMNNKFAWEKGTKGDGQTTNNITIGNMNVLQDKSREGLLETIKMYADKGKDYLDVKFIEQDSTNQSQQSDDTGTTQSS